MGGTLKFYRNNFNNQEKISCSKISIPEIRSKAPNIMKSKRPRHQSHAKSLKPTEEIQIETKESGNVHQQYN
jgi:hypothetical protein